MATRKPKFTLPNVHNFSTYVWTAKGLKQACKLIEEAAGSETKSARGKVETTQGVREVIATHNGIVNRV